MRLPFTLLWLVLLALAPHAAQAARQALIIGNAAYVEGPLKNPVNDARAMDQKLTSLGFKVQRVENMKRQQIGRTLTTFASAISPGDEVVVFYAGHGVQVKGVNYLPAVDADIQSEEDVPLNSLNLNSLMDRLDEAKAGLKLLFLDACRNNPYARSFRGGDRGLARLGAAPSGTLIHFATRPGSVAADGSGANGLYTSQLIRFIDVPDTPVETMLKRVSAAVEQESKGAQEPWTEGGIRGEFIFKAGQPVQLASVRPEPVARQAETAPTEDSEREMFDRGVALSRKFEFDGALSLFKEFLSQYPHSAQRVEAWYRLGNLQMGTRDCESAIKSLQTMLTLEPEHPMAPKAMANLASCLMVTKQARRARALFQEIVDKYPGTESAAFAKSQLAQFSFK